MFYRFIRFLLKYLFGILFQLKVEGCENIPQTGSAIVAANHTSYLDPPLIGVSTKRDVYYLARESLFKIWGFGWLIKKVHAFPVKTGVWDYSGFKTVFNLLHKNEIILVFPEGTRSKNGLLQKPYLGIGMIIYKMKVPVIPALITGAHKALPRGSKKLRINRIKVEFGKPISLEDYFDKTKNKQTYKLISEKIMEEIEKLKTNHERTPPAVLLRKTKRWGRQD